MRTALALALVAGLASVASAQATYTDSQNELFNNGFGHLDITSVNVSHDANNITFVINVRDSLDASDWGKYCLGIDTGAVGGNAGNGWGRNISWGTGQGIDCWVGSWVDSGGGAELRNPLNLIGATYNNDFQGSVSDGGTVRTIVLSRAALGLTGNDTFRFDVVSTAGGGGDPGVDHLSRSDMATSDWGVQSTAGQFLTYTIPTPGALALVGLGGLVAARRRRA
jgi:uncharacterized protein (TIGR03382 family)